MYATSHELHPTTRQQAVYDAHPYHFLIHYNHRWDGGYGNGHLHYGIGRPDFTAFDAAEFTQKVAAITAANMQAAGMPFNPDTLIVEITDVVPLDRHDTKEQ